MRRLALALLLAGCSSTPIVAGSAAAPQPPGDHPAPIVAPAPIAGAPARPGSDFVESSARRDPFRAFPELFAPPPPPPVDLPIVLADAAVDDLRPIAIVRAGSVATAMIVDASGRGETVRRGDWVGRPEVITSDGADPITLAVHWRVARIHEDEIVLVREGAAGDATRVLALRAPS